MRAARKSRGIRAIDPAEAKEGKLDFVQVRRLAPTSACDNSHTMQSGTKHWLQVSNWGRERDADGQPKLENLAVDSFSEQDADLAGPLYTVLAKRLQLLEVCSQLHAICNLART